MRLHYIDSNLIRIVTKCTFGFHFVFMVCSYYINAGDREIGFVCSIANTNAYIYTQSIHIHIREYMRCRHLRYKMPAGCRPTQTE